MSFETRLGLLRKSAGITQGELAKAIGASQSTISQLEAGTRRPSYQTLQAIARALSIPVSSLLSGEMEGLSKEEEEHFREYRSLSPEAREELRQYTRFLKQRYKTRGGKTK